MRSPVNLIDVLEKRPHLSFLGIALLHAFAWIMVPVLTQPNAPLDTLEMVYWGREWQLGYYKHPPMPGWLAAIICYGQNDAWPTYVLAQIATLTCFWCVFEVGRTMLGNVKGLLAVLLMQGCYYYNFTTVEFNNNVTSRAFWAIAILCLYKAIRDRKSVLPWMFAGLALGCGMLSKYDTAILALVMLLFSLIHSRGRECWRTAGPYICLAIALLVFAPHLYWLFKHDFPTIAYFLRRSAGPHELSAHLIGPAKFGLAQLLAIAPIALLAVPLTGWRWNWRRADKQECFDRDFLLWFVLGPFLLVLVIGVVLGVQIRSMWGTAMWTYASLCLLFFVKVRIDSHSVNRSAKAIVGFGLLAILVFTARNIVLPEIRRDASRVHFPGRELAKRAVEQYRKSVGHDPLVVAGPWWEAANVAFYAGNQPTVYADADPHISPWMNDDLFAERGGVIVWQRSAGSEDEDFEKAIVGRFPQLQLEAPVDLNWQTTANLQPLRFSIATLAPKNTLDSVHGSGDHGSRQALLGTEGENVGEVRY